MKPKKETALPGFAMTPANKFNRSEDIGFHGFSKKLREQDCIPLPNRIRTLLCLLFLPLFLGSCYLPDNFLAEIRLNYAGGYVFTYKGKLTWVPLYADIVQGNISPEEADEKINKIKEDLERDSYFTTVESLGRGQYEVFYERQGVLQPSEQVTFVRRNAIIMTMVSKEDGQVDISVPRIPQYRMAQLEDMDLSTLGRFRITTNAQVTSHNAPVAGPYPQGYPGFYVFDWDIKSLSTSAPRWKGQRRPARNLPRSP